MRAVAGQSFCSLQHIQSTNQDTPKHNDDSDWKSSSKPSSSESAINSLLKKLPDLDNIFHIHEKIGEGTFSNVYLATLKGVFNSNKQFAVKHLIPTSHPKRMQYELDCLIRIGGKDNVVSCDLTMRQADCVVIVMPYLKHHKFASLFLFCLFLAIVSGAPSAPMEARFLQASGGCADGVCRFNSRNADYVLDMNIEETKLYMKNLLLALKRVHSFNIIHRDIKPSNFLYNRESKKFLLVDFGLSQSAIENDYNLPKPNIKRKRENDDLENAENPKIKRYAAETITSGKQEVKLPASRFAREPQYYKGPQATSIKRQPLSSNSSNVFNYDSEKVGPKQSFQILMPQKSKSIDTKASFVRVQNSQVQTRPMFSRPTVPVPSTRRDQCRCTGRPQVCNICVSRKAQYAPRAGTPGFRPPEVLLKYPQQTTAVDMWAAGVIMLCILSGCYPFFRSPDDITALCEIITVFGTEAITKLAKKFGRNVVCSESRRPLNLRLLCESLRRRKASGSLPEPGEPLCEKCHHSVTEERGCLCEDKCKIDLTETYFPAAAFDLLVRLLDVDPDTRISAEEALQHPFITEISSPGVFLI